MRSVGTHGADAGSAERARCRTALLVEVPNQRFRPAPQSEPSVITERCGAPLSLDQCKLQATVPARLEEKARRPLLTKPAASCVAGARVASSDPASELSESPGTIPVSLRLPLGATMRNPDP